MPPPGSNLPYPSPPRRPPVRSRNVPEGESSYDRPSRSVEPSESSQNYRQHIPPWYWGPLYSPHPDPSPLYNYNGDKSRGREQGPYQPPEAARSKTETPFAASAAQQEQAKKEREMRKVAERAKMEGEISARIRLRDELEAERLAAEQKKRLENEIRAKLKVESWEEAAERQAKARQEDEFDKRARDRILRSMDEMMEMAKQRAMHDMEMEKLEAERKLVELEQLRIEIRAGIQAEMAGQQGQRRADDGNRHDDTARPRPKSGPESQNSLHNHHLSNISRLSSSALTREQKRRLPTQDSKTWARRPPSAPNAPRVPSDDQEGGGLSQTSSEPPASDDMESDSSNQRTPWRWRARREMKMRMNLRLVKEELIDPLMYAIREELAEPPYSSMPTRLHRDDMRYQSMPGFDGDGSPHHRTEREQEQSQSGPSESEPMESGLALSRRSRSRARDPDKHHEVAGHESRKTSCGRSDQTLDAAPRPHLRPVKISNEVEPPRAALTEVDVNAETVEEEPFSEQPNSNKTQSDEMPSVANGRVDAASLPVLDVGQVAQQSKERAASQTDQDTAARWTDQSRQLAVANGVDWPAVGTTQF